MAKTKISEYSATPASNTDINNIDIAEGCSPSGINNAIRELMSDLKDWQAGNVGGQALVVASGGTGAENATDARTNLSAAQSGANTDITSLGGLTTPISVAQGGTGYVSTRDITYVTVASNVVTIETSVAHGFVVNDIVAVTAVTNTNVNGTGFTIASVPSTTTFTYDKTAANYARTADTGTVVSSSYLTVANLSGVSPVIHGGTGSATLKANNLLVGNGTSAVSVIPAGTTGNVLTSTQTSSVAIASLVEGTEYTISATGTGANWTSIGAASDAVGTVFTKNSVAGTGTSATATTNTWTSAALNRLTAATTQASTSGTSIDFTSIPSGVKRITVMLNGVSINGTSGILIQLGTSSGFVSSGYDAGTIQGTNSLSLTSTSGVPLRVSNASNTYSGLATWALMGSNLWACNVVTGSTVTTSMVFGGGNVNTGGTVNSVRITTVNGTDAFDAGSINIMYE